MMSNFNPKSIPEPLIDCLQKSKCGIFVGAGLSVGVGLPDWQGLISELIDLVSHMPDISKERINEFKKLSKNSSKYLLLAEELKEILAGDFQKFMAKRFIDDAPEPAKNHLELIQLPYKFIITTNYDILLERAFIKKFADQPNVITYRQPEAISYNLWNARKFILKAHGDPQDIILTEKDYRRILYREPGYQSILQTLFTTNSILFLGSSLNDPELSLLLGYIHNAFHEGGPTHFALLDEGKISRTETKRWRKDFNVIIIPYDSVNQHKQILQFLKALRKRLI